MRWNILQLGFSRKVQFPYSFVSGIWVNVSMSDCNCKQFFTGTISVLNPLDSWILKYAPIFSLLVKYRSSLVPALCDLCVVLYNSYIFLVSKEETNGDATFIYIYLHFTALHRLKIIIQAHGLWNIWCFRWFEAYVNCFSQVYASEISRDKEGSSMPYLFRWEYSF
jgi:hypothetical protein